MQKSAAKAVLIAQVNKNAIFVEEMYMLVLKIIVKKKIAPVTIEAKFVIFIVFADVLVKRPKHF